MLPQTENIGDNELPASAPAIALPGPAVAVATGQPFTCALLATGKVWCWGGGPLTVNGFDDGRELLLGGKAVSIAVGWGHGCAVMEGGGVRCWGEGKFGKLGYGNVADVVDPVTAGDVPLGGPAKAVAPGNNHTCALMMSGAVRCWGEGTGGLLGYGNVANIGDDEPASAAGDVPIGGTAIAVTTGYTATCALLDSGAVRCWGRDHHGQGNGKDLGDDEPPSNAPTLRIGGRVTAIEGGRTHSCAILETGALRCWGSPTRGQLGYGNVIPIAEDKGPAIECAGDVPLL
jgi:alpha-tubulin suppressor-like RCC1 family protein